MAPELKPIEPKTPRWEPSADPADIVVPGLDTTAAPYDQIEQIEQLITIKLQNIDANFSKIQHVMANRILPAVKRYAVGTQPVREAAKFWTTFYETAAQIRIPSYEDYSAGQEQTEDEQTADSSQVETESTPAESSATTHSDESDGETPHPDRTYDRTPSEVSFAPGQAAVSSTPADAYRSRSRNAPDNSFANEASEPMPSWSASLESPLRQLNRDIQSLADDRSVAVPSTSALNHSEAFDDSQDVTQRATGRDSTLDDHTALHTGDKGKAREGPGPQPLLQKVLHRNANSSNLTSATGTTSRTTSPLKFKPKTPVAKTLNPYLPPDTKPSDWKGVVDLKDPSVASPQRSARKFVPPPSSSIKLSAYMPSAAFTARAGARSGTGPGTKTPPPGEDDSFDENFGMSPPVMTNYARLPKLGRTPKQEAAARIMKDLVDVERRGVFGPAGAVAKGKGPAGTGYGTESSMSSMPTPPSMTRYGRPSYAPPVASETSASVVDASLDSIMRRVGLNVPGYGSQKAVLAPAPVAQPARAPVFSSISSASASSATGSSASSVFTATSSRSAASASSARTLQPPAPDPEPSIHTPQPPQYDFYDDEVIGRGGPGDGDDSLDSLDYEDQNTANAPADFLFANQEQSFDSEDSFDSSLDGDDEATDGTAPPFIVTAQDDGDEFDDDSYDDGLDALGGEEETVFGVPPAQRLAQQQAQMAMSGGGLRMLGEDLLQDTIGIGQQMAMAGRVEESPTPWVPRG
ncbi:hypothetical protein DICSQDRAFT_102405 [Dichomitus squalens LYAD-421 SS1]|uniref:uncharacterized protein n=1 Tax=Dichomitus squalens (strain LYAD-421) TaxID=732165 RepID=UPI0004415E75|nr:uncharacterized protein DICSQDRAFT_102405 [Dichomitus squalens LYAD-421 SS1]EJF63269.1 hypothetical protein DICSQDRAFT_102405 [Dichomitus squalens LYAD-421 SS1]